MASLGQDDVRDNQYLRPYSNSQHQSNILTYMCDGIYRDVYELVVDCHDPLSYSVPLNGNKKKISKSGLIAEDSYLNKNT